MGTKLETVKREGVDIVFALDVSKSMLAEDIAPSRLDKAKQIITRIIENLGSDRIGIIIYAGNSYPLLPITTDHAAAKMFLQNANPDMVSSQGTAINEAIERGITYFDNDEQTNRFLFIVSDGEDHEEGAIKAAEEAQAKGVSISTIGVGSSTGVPIPQYKDGMKSGFRRDKAGNTVVTKLNEALLMDIAAAGKGAYVRANNTEVGLNAIMSKLQEMEKKEIESKIKTLQNELALLKERDNHYIFDGKELVIYKSSTARENSIVLYDKKTNQTFKKSTMTNKLSEILKVDEEKAEKIAESIVSNKVFITESKLKANIK